MISSKNFTIKQIGSFWRVVGPGGKLLDGAYRIRQQALVALKEEVSKFFSQRSYGFVKTTEMLIEEELKRIENEKVHQRIKENGKNGNVCERQEIRHETPQGDEKTKEERQVIMSKGKKSSKNGKKCK